MMASSSFSQSEPDASFVRVHGKRMAYVDQGAGPAVVFLHGNPTSSYLWRNIMPHVTGRARALAPDLIGMGRSDKLDAPDAQSYRFAEHKLFLDGFMDAIVPDGPVVLVVHDWGSALGFDWAMRHANRVRGLCFMEAIIAPFEDWTQFPEGAREVFKGLRSPAGEEMVLDNNMFVEKILPASIIRPLTDDEMSVYRRPFVQPGEDRRPTLTWPREIPIAGEPADVDGIVRAYGEWLANSPAPKLFIDVQPGAITTDRLRKMVRQWPNVTETSVKGIHFVQEDSPDEIGQALSAWLAGLA